MIQGRNTELQSTSTVIKKITSQPQSSPIHYIVFMSLIVKINGMLNKRTTPTQLFNIMKTYAVLDEKHNRYIMQIWWPKNAKRFHINSFC